MPDYKLNKDLIGLNLGYTIKAKRGTYNVRINADYSTDLEKIKAASLEIIIPLNNELSTLIAPKKDGKEIEIETGQVGLDIVNSIAEGGADSLRINGLVRIDDSGQGYLDLSIPIKIAKKRDSL